MTQPLKCQLVFAIETDGSESTAADKAARKVGLECSPIGARTIVEAGDRRVALFSPREPVACSDVPDLLRWTPKLMLSVEAAPGDNLSLYYVTENQVVSVERRPMEPRSVFITGDCFASCVAFALPHSAVFRTTESCPAWLQENIEFFCDVQKSLISSLVQAQK